MAAALLLTACGEPPPAVPVAVVDSTGADLPLTVHAHLDSAATAYRAGAFEQARVYYRMAIDSIPDLAASWFGLFLAERALGNRGAADSAMRQARRLVTGDSITRRDGI
jgi:hypothetical protein